MELVEAGYSELMLSYRVPKLILQPVVRIDPPVSRKRKGAKKLLIQGK